jgi:hypothetical protein
MADDPRRLDTLETTIANLRRELESLKHLSLHRLSTHTHGDSGGGVTDHGALTGLGDDDHTQYLTQARGDARYYTETETDTLLGGKANTSHTHAASAINSGTLDIARIPTGTSGTTVALGNHTHAQSAITQTGVGAMLMARCTADTSKTSNTTLGDVTGMSVTLEANATYALNAAVIYTGNSVGDFKFAWSGPSGVGGSWAALGPRVNQNPTGAGERFNYTDFGVLSITTTLNLSADSAFPILAMPHGFVTTGGTGGTFKLQFAQDFSDGTATVVKAGSWMRLVRIA